MKKSIVIATTVIGLSTAIFAYGMGSGKCGGMENRGPMMEQGMPKDMRDRMHKDPLFMALKKLDLTKEQKDALRELKNEGMSQRKAMREKMRDERQEPDISKVMTANTFDKAAFKMQMLRQMEQREAMMKESRGEMLEERADHMQKVFEILTPEQRTKWIELSQQKVQ